MIYWKVRGINSHNDNLLIASLAFKSVKKVDPQSSTEH